MKIKLINLGKTTVPYLREGESDYENRLKHYIKFERIDIKDIKVGKNTSTELLKKEEAEHVFSCIKENDVLVLLDEKGELYCSIEFSKWMIKKQASNSRQLVVLIGGAFGFDSSIYARANEKISISKMTFSHQMIRLLFLEQLYRAHTILKGEKYHHV